MRRLLAFGTGAALIGLVLLLIAFFESYVIVSKLQEEIANQTAANVNTILEDATLEAVFLGVMVALGYGLISQGLNGIRRQEMLEIDQSEEDQVVKARVMAKITRDRAVEQARKREVRHVITSKGIESSTTSEPVEVESPKMIAPLAGQDNSAQEQPAPEVPESLPAPPPQSLLPEPGAAAAEVREAPLAIVQEIGGTTSSRDHTQESPVTGTSTPSPSELTKTPETPAEEPVATTGEPAVSTEPQVAAEPVTYIPEVEPKEVIWEGGPPPKLEGVEILPEPPEHGMFAPPPVPPGQAESSEQQDAAGSPPAKRGRGRPKGSKSKKKQQADQEDPEQQQQQEQQPSSA